MVQHRYYQVYYYKLFTVYVRIPLTSSLRIPLIVTGTAHQYHMNVTNMCATTSPGFLTRTLRTNGTLAYIGAHAPRLMQNYAALADALVANIIWSLTFVDTSKRQRTGNAFHKSNQKSTVKDANPSFAESFSTKQMSISTDEHRVLPNSLLPT